jgi:hypothetical protein
MAICNRQTVHHFLSKKQYELRGAKVSVCAPLHNVQEIPHIDEGWILNASRIEDRIKNALGSALGREFAELFGLYLFYKRFIVLE